MITKTERPFLVHAIAFCDNCGFSEEDYKKAVQKGREVILLGTPEEKQNG